MKLPKAAHTSRPWRVHEIAKDFELEDVWELRTPGGPDDLARLVEWFAGDDEDGEFFSGVFGALFALRWKLGELFGWDRPGSGVGERVRSLRERLPADLLEAPRGPDLRAVPFTSVYETHDEWVAEMANMTCHAAMHIGWVADDSDSGYHAQMAVLVKPNGRFGKVYMAAIRPLRRVFVYPSLLRRIERQWHVAASAVERLG
jgi:hypothetical protein